MRELEGALNILMTKKTLMEKEIDKEDILDCLGTLGYKIAHDEEEQPLAVSNRST